MKKPVLVVLPGWGLSAAKFQPLINEFVRHKYTTIGVDFPGCGTSDLPKTPLSLDDYVRFLDHELTQRKINDCIFVAHSFGGRVALQYLFSNNKNVRALILSGTPGFSSINKIKFFLFVAVAKIGNAIVSHIIGATAAQKIRLWYYNVIGARDFYRAEGVMRQTFKNVVNTSLLPAMKSLTIPTVLVWGKNDKIVPIVIAEKMKTVIQQSTLITIPNEGHGVPFENPSIFYQSIKNFLQSV